jgi:hypothetical protein
MTGFSVSIMTEHGGHRILIASESVRLETPPVEHLAFYLGLGVLVVVNLVELPVALALTIGHLLLDLTRRPGLDALGEALEEA